MPGWRSGSQGPLRRHRRRLQATYWQDLGRREQDKKTLLQGQKLYSGKQFQGTFLKS